MGLSKGIDHPFVGVLSSWNAVVPCNVTPRRQTPSAERGVDAADGTPRQLCTMVSGGIAVGRSGGKAQAVHNIGGVPRFVRVLGAGGDLNADSLAVTGRNAAPTLENVKSDRDQEVVCPVAHPISAAGEVVGLQGSRVPEGTLVKVAGMARLQFRDPARVFDCEEASFRAVESRADKDGDVLMRCAGPQAGGMRATRPTMGALYGQGDGQGAGRKVTLIPEGRFCGGTRGLRMGHVRPATAEGGPIAHICDGGIVTIGAAQGTLDLDVSEAELAVARHAWKAPANPYQSGTLRKYADEVGPARAVAHAGTRAEVVCYADI